MLLPRRCALRVLLPSCCSSPELCPWTKGLGRAGPALDAEQPFYQISNPPGMFPPETGSGCLHMRERQRMSATLNFSSALCCMAILIHPGSTQKLTSLLLSRCCNRNKVDSMPTPLYLQDAERGNRIASH